MLGNIVLVLACGFSVIVFRVLKNNQDKLTEPTRTRVMVATVLACVAIMGAGLYYSHAARIESQREQGETLKKLWDLTKKFPVGNADAREFLQPLEKALKANPEMVHAAFGDDELQALKTRLEQEAQISQLKSNLDKKIEEMNALKKEVDAKKQQFEKMRPLLDRLEAAGKAYESGKRVAPAGNCSLIVTFDSDASKDDHSLAMLAAALALESRTDNFKTTAGTKSTCRFPNLDRQYADDHAEQFRKLGASVEIQNGAGK